MKSNVLVLCSVFVFAAVLLFSNVTNVNAEKTSQHIDKKEIEKIVHDYIMDNPVVILKTVENYQKRNDSERRAVALTKNAKLLFEDPATPLVGNPNGDVTVIEFFDYNCGYCKRVWPDLAKLIASDDKIKVLFKEHPILGPSSEMAARWALASRKQGKYFEFHKELIQSRGTINEEKLIKIAKKLDLDVGAMKKIVNDDDITVNLQKTHALAVELGLTGTPAFIIGDQVIPGAVSYDQLKIAVAEQRKKK